jgi:Trk K+ transport system NAD-binding subunit
MSTNANTRTTPRSTDDARSGGAAPAGHFVLGGDHVGVAIAQRLRAAGHAVTFVDEACDAGDGPDLEADLTDLGRLAESGLETAESVIVGTRSDARNLLVAQLVRTRFGVPRIVVLVNDPELVPVVADADHEPFCVTTALSGTVAERI